MRWRGLEPPRPKGHKALNLARLPIPPPARGAALYWPQAGEVSSRGGHTQAMPGDELFPGGLAELHTHLGGSVATRHHVEPRARAGNRAADARFLGVRPDGDGVGSAWRARPRLARPDLPPDRADPVVADRGRAVGARGDRRRVPVAGDHDARAAVQPDEAQPRRRARPRPHHPGGDPRPRPRLARVPAGAGRADPDDGPDVLARAEHGDRREGDCGTRRAGSSVSISRGRGRAARAGTTRRSRGTSRRRAPRARA